MPTTRSPSRANSVTHYCDGALCTRQWTESGTPVGLHVVGIERNKRDFTYAIRSRQKVRQVYQSKTTTIGYTFIQLCAPGGAQAI